MSPRFCPFCGTVVAVSYCSGCGRDPTAPRKVCRACGEMTPIRDPNCCHCGARFTSDLSWKIPVIIALFVAALVLAVVVEVVVR